VLHDGRIRPQISRQRPDVTIAAFVENSLGHTDQSNGRSSVPDWPKAAASISVDFSLGAERSRRRTRWGGYFCPDGAWAFELFGLLALCLLAS
jgi:hypothetical protein